MRIWVLISFLIVTGCSTPAPTAMLPPQVITSSPSATLTQPAPPTQTSVLATLAPQPTADPNFFRDDFSGSLDPQWNWVREDPEHWSLEAEPGQLQINAANGTVERRTIVNLLLRPAPADNFQIETQVDFHPQNNYEFAGLIIYESDATFIQAGRGFCSNLDCVREGLYMNHYEERLTIKPSFGQPFRDSEPIRLRLSRQGNTYTFEGSTNGKVWFLIGAHTSDMTPTQIGLVSGQHGRGGILTASFDYFEVRSLP